MARAWSKAHDRMLMDAAASGQPKYARLATLTGRSVDAVRNRAFRLGLTRPAGVPWYDGLRIGFLDIETTNLEANAGSMLSWAIKYRKGPVVGDVVTRHEQISCEFDARITASLLATLEDLDVVVTYYGTGFDVPFLRTRALALGLTPPGAGDLYHWDVYYLVRHKLKLHRNSLQAACALFGIGGKTHLDMEIWARARVGDPDALAYVYDHNKADVRILARLFDRVETQAKWQRRPL